MNSQLSLGVRFYGAGVCVYAFVLICLSLGSISSYIESHEITWIIPSLSLSHKWSARCRRTRVHANQFLCSFIKFLGAGFLFLSLSCLFIYSFIRLIAYCKRRACPSARTWIDFLQQKKIISWESFTRSKNQHLFGQSDPMSFMIFVKPNIEYTLRCIVENEKCGALNARP